MILFILIYVFNHCFLLMILKIYFLLKDTHREKTLSKKTAALTKSMNMDIWVVVTSNQLFVRGSKLEQNFQKNKVDTGKTLFFLVAPFVTHHCICLS